MIKANDFKQFLKKLLFPHHHRLNFLLFSLFLLSFPVQNSYASQEIEAGQPVVRELNVNLPKPEIYPVHIGIKPPAISARSSIIVDVDSKAVLFAKNPDWQLFPASTTKMMTALTAQEAFDDREIITVPQIESVGQTMKLIEGEKITVENLLYGLLVCSGNDAAEVLASSYPGGREKFVEKMNEKAKSLRLEETSFKNPSGVEEVGHISTTHDLAILAAEFLKDPLLEKIVKTKQITITDESGKTEHKMENINELLGKVEGLKGIKTGWTTQAGECLVAFIERDGKKIITAVLGSDDRFGETEKLIEWIYANHEWKKL